MNLKKYFGKIFLIDHFLHNIFSIFIKLFFGNRSFLQGSFQPDSFDLIELDSNEGQELLANSSCSLNYDLLSKNIQAQDTFNYCGVATIVMILNAFASNSTHSLLDFPSITTQKSVFENRIKPTLFLNKVFLGLTLKQLKQLFETYSLKTTVYYAEESLSLERFRDLSASNLNKPNSFVIVNYWRRSLNQKGWGHISPLGAYNSEVDSFLILDVARHRYPSVWVKTKILYSAMRIREFSFFGKPRGFLVVSKNKND